MGIYYHGSGVGDCAGSGIGAMTPPERRDVPWIIGVGIAAVVLVLVLIAVMG